MRRADAKALAPGVSTGLYVCSRYYGAGWCGPNKLCACTGRRREVCLKIDIGVQPGQTAGDLQRAPPTRSAMAWRTMTCSPGSKSR